jgi:glycosyltransferase involved in cell wall biosynthesis
MLKAVSNPVRVAEILLILATSDKSVSIVVPTRNEVENVGPLVSQIVASGVPFREILFVDADSTDGTLDIIRSLAANHPIRIVEQNPAQPGLASAIMVGAAAAASELLLIMDADLSHPPERIKDLLEPLQEGAADMVIGAATWPVDRHRDGLFGAECCREQVRHSLIRLPARTIRCAASLPSRVLGYWNWRRRQLASKLPLK